MDESSLVCDGAIASDEDVIGDRLSEDLDLEYIGDDFLGLTVNVGMYEGDVVVARNNVSERRQSLLYTLYRDAIWEGIAEVLELLVGRCRRDEETMTVS